MDDIAKTRKKALLLFHENESRTISKQCINKSQHKNDTCVNTKETGIHSKHTVWLKLVKDNLVKYLRETRAVHPRHMRTMKVIFKHSSVRHYQAYRWL